MRGWDPALIIRLRSRRDSRAIGTDNSDLVGRIDLLSALRGTLGALTPLAAALLLRKEVGDPSVVDKVDSSSKRAEKDKVEEDAGRRMSVCAETGDGGHIHLRVQEASGRLNNADRLIVHRNSVESLLAVLEHSPQLQTQILGVQLSGEGIGHRLLCSSGDVDRVLARSEVAHNLLLAGHLLDQRTANERHGNGRGLLVVDGEAGFGGMAVDELDAEDLRLWEGDGYGDIEFGCLRLLVDVDDLFDLSTRVLALMSWSDRH